MEADRVGNETNGGLSGRTAQQFITHPFGEYIRYNNIHRMYKNIFDK
ncbi:ATP-binding protein [Butyrivibrio sp. FCS014]|nr:ATP-binding protein [Butyrivibrio sp. FCS014]